MAAHAAGDERAWRDLAVRGDLDAPRRRTAQRVLGPMSGSVVGGLLLMALDRLHPLVRDPLDERLALVQEGGLIRVAALVAGSADWCPPRHAAERTVHLLGATAWHTRGLVSQETPLPLADLTPVAVRRPRPQDDVEELATRRRRWLVVDLVGTGPDGDRGSVAAHEGDLALMALLAGWTFPGPPRSA